VGLIPTRLAEILLEKIDLEIRRHANAELQRSRQAFGDAVGSRLVMGLGAQDDNIKARGAVAVSNRYGERFSALQRRAGRCFVARHFLETQGTYITETNWLEARRIRHEWV
jgi:hypothetical protein